MRKNACKRRYLQLAGISYSLLYYLITLFFFFKIAEFISLIESYIFIRDFFSFVETGWTKITIAEL